jgi:hypothetical protein
VSSRHLRFAIEAAAVIAVAVGARLAHLGRTGITLAVAVVWIDVGAAEYRLSR